MSAYIVSDETVSVIVKAFEIYNITHYSSDCNEFIEKKRQAIGQSLVDQNYRSVNYHYRENDKPHKFEFTDINLMVNGKPDTGLIVGCIDCYNYQACENDDYWQSHIYHSLRWLKDTILNQYIKQDGFEKSWGYRK